MLSRIIVVLLLMTSAAYAEINPVTVDDVKDHEKIASKLNKIIDKINQDTKDDKDDAKELRKLIKYQLGVDDKIVKKMIQKGWVATHVEVEPN